MASIYSGRGTALGIGEESTWGTAVSRVNWRPAISSNLLRTIERVPRPNLQTGAAGVMRRSHFTAADNAGGTCSIELTYENCGMWVKHLMGSAATTEVLRGESSSRANSPINSGGRRTATTLVVPSGRSLTMLAEPVLMR